MKQSSEELTRRVAELEGQVNLLKTLLEESRQREAELTRQAASTPGTDSMDIVRAMLTLTLKQRAVVFATWGGASYHEIATVMGVDDTTVKLHLKAALGKLGMDSRATLVSTARQATQALASVDQESLFGLRLDWMRSPSKELLATLAPTRRQTPPVRR